MPATAAPAPERRTLRALRVAARGCRAYHQWKRATQTVFGEGRPTADVMIVGEQPGNDEPDPAARRAAMRAFVRDLRKLAAKI